jgi:hypothetical protein
MTSVSKGMVDVARAVTPVISYTAFAVATPAAFVVTVVVPDSPTPEFAVVVIFPTKYNGLNAPDTDPERLYVDPLKYGAPLNDREVAVNTAIEPVTVGVCAGIFVDIVANGAQNISLLLVTGVLYNPEPLAMEIDAEI